MQRGSVTPAPDSNCSISCERCRKRKIKCDRRMPCSKCTKAEVDCSFPGGGERQRPASKKHVQALQNQIASLESLVQKLAAADDTSRNELLATAVTSEAQQNPVSNYVSPSPSASSSGDIFLGRAREGRMRKLNSRKATQFYGGTSLFEIQLSGTSSRAFPRSNTGSSITSGQIAHNSPGTFEHDSRTYEPHGQICRQLLSIFFQNVYQYNMCIYREYFLRDYAAGGGPYYSDMLMYSICATAALVSEDASLKILSPSFAKKATSLLYDSLELPELTTLQSLLVLGQLEIGQGRGSKGWLFCGMACRLTHEMGLHLDPNNWNVAADSSIDREVLRRVYWAAFIVDKQLSLYFGRPPALYPHGADVRNTIRIPYPPEWESLLDTYVSKGSSAHNFEDGLAIVAAFTHQVELAKIFHTMIVDIFENRHRKIDITIAAATAQRIHTSLAKWLTVLPQKLHWNQWTVDQVPPYVLHLHMLFHTGMIILHRPSRQYLDDEAVVRGEDVEVCYESLGAVLRLMRVYSRHYRFEALPLDFVHTLSAAAGVILMKRYLEKSSWEDKDISKPLAQILDAMGVVESVWPCISEIKEGILETISPAAGSDPQQDYNTDFNLMGMLEYGPGSLPNPWFTGIESNPGDLCFLVTDDFLNGFGN
ncbi:fungal-specific transcription factor domain-containing protein [Leptodontidium sp. MPI-SDFR-AT-0119]|nr:fungal-specific transcription factor domain-containing protein [Leptodontidium sp. MPI-SDFR-AT-0119]